MAEITGSTGRQHHPSHQNETAWGSGSRRLSQPVHSLERAAGPTMAGHRPRARLGFSEPV